MQRDTRTLLAAQGVRALAYGFGAVLLGASLASEGLSSPEVGVLLTAVVGGMAVMSIVVGSVGDRLGRRRTYALLFIGLAGSGLTFALTTRLWVLILVALTGTLSTGVSENGPFTSLELAMLPAGLGPRARNRVFGTYNAVAASAGSLGALAAGGPAVLRRVIPAVPADHRLFAVFVPVGIAGGLLALSLTPSVEVAGPRPRGRAPLKRSRSIVIRLSSLFAVDSLAGGFVLQTFIAYWLRQRFGVSLEALGVVFFATGLLQTVSYVVAPRLAERFGLLNTMVFTHLPSNVLLILLGLAPTLPVALGLLFGRSLLSQMDVPTRQAYLMALVDDSERTAAAAYSNSARNLTRPIGPALAGASQQLGLGAPFLIAGGLKCAYDGVLWLWFRSIPEPRLGEEAAAECQPVEASTPPVVAGRSS